MTRFTDAPEAYDGFGTVTEAIVGKSHRGEIRRVKIEDEHADWQMNRYESGMYIACDSRILDSLCECELVEMYEGIKTVTVHHLFCTTHNPEFMLIGTFPTIEEAMSAACKASREADDKVSFDRNGQAHFVVISGERVVLHSDTKGEITVQ